MPREAQDKVRLWVGLLLIWIQLKNNDNKSYITLNISFAGLAVRTGHIWLNGKPCGSYRGHHWGGSKMNKWAQLLWSELNNVFIYLHSLYHAAFCMWEIQYWYFQYCIHTLQSFSAQKRWRFFLWQSLYFVFNEELLLWKKKKVLQEYEQYEWQLTVFTQVTLKQYWHLLLKRSIAKH